MKSKWIILITYKGNDVAQILEHFVSQRLLLRFDFVSLFLLILQTYENVFERVDALLFLYLFDLDYFSDWSRDKKIEQDRIYLKLLFVRTCCKYIHFTYEKLLIFSSILKFDEIFYKKFEYSIGLQVFSGLAFQITQIRSSRLTFDNV